MSITGVTGVSSTAYLQPSQNAAPANAPSQAAGFNATLTSLTGATQQTGQVHHHHHHHGGGAASDLTQTGTDTAGGTGLLNTVV